MGPRFFLPRMFNDVDGLTAEFRRRVADLGFELVDLRRRGSHRRPMIQARIDIPNSSPGHGISVDDCGRVSRSLEAWLDEGNFLGQTYVLEVSSPGMERPVRWVEHWRRYMGQDVKVKLPGRGRVQATIIGVAEDDTTVTLKVAGSTETTTVPLGDARDATLVVDWD